MIERSYRSSTKAGSTAQDNVADRSRIHIAISKKWVVIVSAATLLLAICGTATAIYLRDNSGTPFSASIMSSVQFPLYYPTYTPVGFHIDRSSVTEPQAEVVVMTLDGPNGVKLYMSQEQRPDKFDIGGYYNKFSDLKEVAMSNGGVAIGKVNGGHTVIGSRTINNSWILANSNANIPLPQMLKLMKSLTVSS